MRKSIGSPAGISGRKREKFRIRRNAAAAAVAAAAMAMAGGAAAPAFAQSAPAPAPSPTSVSSQLAPSGSSALSSTVSYWTRSRMLSARNADAVSTKPAGRAPASHAAPSGPAVRIAGAGPTRALRGGARPGTAPAGGKATPMTGPIGTPWTGSLTLPPATTTGVVFFTTTGNGVTESWRCSASTVNSAAKNEVFTAGHCVYGSIGGQVPGETWHTHWAFVPDYRYGSAPYGVWTARQLWTLTAYVGTQDEGVDMGAAVMNANGFGQQIVNVLGGQGLAVNEPYLYVYNFGYPAQPPFNGAVLDYCSGLEFGWPYVAGTMGMACNFTGGSSGGPWLAFFGGELGYINGVNAFKYASLPSYIFSPYFGTDAYNLYLAA
jgi:hypothetical protein